MVRFLLTRISLIIPTFIGMTLLAFFLIRIVPGDPIETMAGERASIPRGTRRCSRNTVWIDPCSCSTGSTSAACYTVTSASR